LDCFNFADLLLEILSLCIICTSGVLAVILLPGPFRQHKYE
jgi:hypothetical protein